MAHLERDSLLNARCVDALRRLGRRALAGALLGAALCASSAPRLEDFTPTTWARWQNELPRPAIVVFSTTYCPTCPEVFAELASSTRNANRNVPLIAVVMDTDGRDEVPHLKHYGVADRLFVFRGPEAALRFSVDPKWRGVTPYVALFGTQGPPVLTAGRPTAQQVKQALEPR